MSIKRFLMIFCIVILLLLSYKVVWDSKHYDCEDCEIRFKSHVIGDGTDNTLDTFDMEIPIILMYNEFMDGRCLIQWQENLGYQVNPIIK